MKSETNIKNIIKMFFMVTIISMFFLNVSFAASIGTINVETANLRESASKDSAVLELISLNEKVEIIEKVNDWYKVKYKGIEGYLRGDLIKISDEVQTTQENTNNTNTNAVNNVSENKNTTDESTTEKNNTKVDQVQTEQENRQNETQEENQLEKFKILEDTKIKIIPTINAMNIVDVKKDEEVKAIEFINGWVCIETQTAKGWIREEKINKIDETISNNEEEQQPQQSQQPEQVTGETEEKKTTEEQPQETPQTKKKYINSPSVNLRTQPNTNCEVLKSITINTEVEVISEANGWSKVKVDGLEGYVSSKLLSDTKKETSRGMTEERKTVEDANTQQTSTTVNTTSSTRGAEILETANKYMGAKYVYGGTTPSGFDCSGFTFYVYKQHGITLNRTAAAQYSNGVAVSRDELQQGDLVMFGKSGINHVGIYIGEGRFIHAANPSRGVTTDTIDSGYYYTNYVGARRVL